MESTEILLKKEMGGLNTFLLQNSSAVLYFEKTGKIKFLIKKKSKKRGRGGGGTLNVIFTFQR